MNYITGIHLYRILKHATTLMQGTSPEIHICQHGIDSSIGNQALGVGISGETVTCLTLYLLTIENDGVENLQLIGLTECGHLTVIIDNLCGVRNILERANQIEIVQSSQGCHLGTHLIPFGSGKLCVLGKHLITMGKNLVTEIDGLVYISPVENVHTGVGHTLHDLIIHIVVTHVLMTGSVQIVTVGTKVTPYSQLPDCASHLVICTITNTLKVVLVLPEFFLHDLILWIHGQPIFAGCGSKGQQTYQAGRD